MILVSHLRYICPRSQIFSPKSSSRSFIAGGYIFRSIIYFEFILLDDGLQLSLQEFPLAKKLHCSKVIPLHRINLHPMMGKYKAIRPGFFFSVGTVLKVQPSSWSPLELADIAIAFLLLFLLYRCCSQTPSPVSPLQPNVSVCFLNSITKVELL